MDLAFGLIFLVATRGRMDRLRGSTDTKWRVRCLDPGAHQHGDKTPSAFLDGARNCFACSGCGLTLSAKALADRLGVDWQGVLDGVLTPTDIRHHGEDRGRGMPAKQVRLPREELRAFWSSCGPLALTRVDPHPLDLAVSWFCSHRRWWPAAVDALGMIRVVPLPHANAGPWPDWWPGHLDAWSTHRILALCYEPNGRPAAVHARSVVPTVEPKTRNPRGLDTYSYSGLLFADAAGRSLLLGRPPAALEAIVLVEGLTSTISMALSAMELRRRVAILGGVSGSWSALTEVAWPAGVPGFVAVDRDQAGERYSQEIRASLPAAISLRRWSPPRLSQKVTA